MTYEPILEQPSSQSVNALYKALLAVHAQMNVPMNTPINIAAVEEELALLRSRQELPVIA